MRWFQAWLKTHPKLHTIKTKPIAHARLDTHTEEEVKDWFMRLEFAMAKYKIKQARNLLNNRLKLYAQRKEFPPHIKRDEVPTSTPFQCVLCEPYCHLHDRCSLHDALVCGFCSPGLCLCLDVLLSYIRRSSHLPLELAAFYHVIGRRTRVILEQCRRGVVF